MEKLEHEGKAFYALVRPAFNFVLKCMGGLGPEGFKTSSFSTKSRKGSPARSPLPKDKQGETDASEPNADRQDQNAPG